MKKALIPAIMAFGLGSWGTSATADLSAQCAQDLSGERVTLLVPTAAGGGFDAYARAFAPAVEKYADVSVRVVNMPTAGGRTARTMAGNAAADELVVLIENSTYLVTTPTDGAEADAGDRTFLIDHFDTLGMFYVEEASWLGRADFDFSDFASSTMIASAGGVEEAMFAIFIVGRALGITADIVTGYDGASDQAAAILRGEVDMRWISLTSAMRQARDEVFGVALILSDGPSPVLPDAPYLAGEGSVSWQLSEGLEDDAKAQRRQLAQDVSALLVSARGLHISTNVPAQKRNCIADLVGLALNDTAFIETAEGQGRPVDAVLAEQARQSIAAMSEAHEKLLPVVDAITAELK